MPNALKPSFDALPHELQVMILEQVMLSTLTYNTNSRSYKHIIIQAETLALVNHAWAHDTMSLVRLKVAPWFYEADLSMEREGQWVREERRAPYLLATIETADKMRALAVLDRELIHLHKRLTPLFRGMIAGGRVDHEKVVGAQLFNSLVVECAFNAAMRGNKVDEGKLETIFTAKR